MNKLIANLLERGIFLFLDKNVLKVKYNGISIPDELLKEIKENKNELIRYLKDNEVSLNYKDIISIETPGPFELSSAQRRLWTLSQFEGGSVANNIHLSINLEQKIDIPSFKKAVYSTIDRHEILRTVFREDENGEVRQFVLNGDDLGFVIESKDYRNEKDREQKVREYISEDSYKAFDLEKGPLMRAALLQVEDERYVFYYNMHHIISDGWSMDILRKDVFTYYEAYKENKPVELKPLRIQYKDYSAWQLSQLQEESFKSHRDYWLKSLEGELPVLDLPSSKHRPKVKTYNGYRLGAYICPEVNAKLKKYVNENGGSLFMGLLAAWNILMYRYTSQTDIIIGTPVAGREHADLEDQIGFYVNTLALRNEIYPDENFSELFSRIKQTTLESYSHQMYPFDNVVEELDIRRDISRSAVSDMMLMLQNSKENNIGVKLKKEELERIIDFGKSKSIFDINISFEEIEDALFFYIIYNEDVYEREMIEGLIGHYKQLLNSVLSNPEIKISKVDYLLEKEKYELLISFNNNTVVYPNNKSIAELFEEQVVKTPNNIAVICNSKSFTYKELSEKSNRLANHLVKTCGINPEDFVGLQLQKNEWIIISILGVLKAGAAYVPIDSDYPSLRKHHIAEDAKLKLLISEVSFIHEIDYYEGPILAIDIEFESLDNNLVLSSTLSGPNNLAYVMYTSGSTGKPKGVMIENKSVIRLVKNTNIYTFSSSDKLLSSGAISFDATTFEYWGPLLNGGQLVLCSQSTLLDNKLLKEEIRNKRINIMWFTAGWLNQLVDVDINVFDGLKTIVVGGDRLSPSHIAKLRIMYPSLSIINGYGPTENTTFSITHNILEVGNDIPIGCPINNTQAYILNDQNELNPKGVIGEICLGGDGLARGYLNLNDITNEKFVLNPFKIGERIYKTGDLGRWTYDGKMEFLGRRDTQVKVRGYRIELAEVEYAIQNNIEIEKAVVIVIESENNEKELAAYFTTTNKQNFHDLKQRLSSVLPEYMIPSYFIQIDEMPLNINGKVDKKILPDIVKNGILNKNEYVAPRNEIEEKLVKIWETVLKRENIGVTDNFFDMGGHSLKIIKVINQVNQQFDLNYDLKGVYNEPTIEAMAKQIKTDLWFIESKNENDYNEVKI